MPRHWWIGCYGSDMDGTGDGISLARATADGSLEVLGLAAAAQSPTFLAARDGELFAALEGSGRVERYRVSATSLEPSGGVASGGGSPCQLDFIDGGFVVANYEGGELGVITDELQLSAVIPSTGSGPHAEQMGPHAHCAFRLDATTLLSADLGADRIWIHCLDGTTVTRTGEVALPPGTGPRDIERHPSGLIYVLGEHGKDIHVFEWSDNRLVAVTTVRLPGSLDSDQAAAIAFGGGGSFVYAGLRGSNTIAVLGASADGRELSPIASVSTAGDWPRNLVVDADVLHVANQRSNSIASFRLGADGIPVLIGSPVTTGSPTYLLPAAV